MDKIKKRDQNGRKEQNFSHLNAISATIADRDGSDYDPISDLPAGRQGYPHIHRIHKEKEKRKRKKKEKNYGYFLTLTPQKMV